MAKRLSASERVARIMANNNKSKAHKKRQEKSAKARRSKRANPKTER